MGTVELALSFQDRLKIEVIPGGLPSVGRNAGAKLATTKYVLFLDADVELPESTLLRRALWRMRRRNQHLVTTNIACRQGNFFDDALYAGNNFMQYVGSFLKPFATGMFMLFDREVFWELGGFNERGAVCGGLSAIEGCRGEEVSDCAGQGADDQPAVQETGARQDSVSVLPDYAA